MLDITSNNLPLGLDGYAVTADKSFVDAFNTPKGSVIGNYDYGTLAYKLKHRPFNTSWIIDFKRACKDACKHDPRLVFKGVKVDTKDASIGKIYFEVEIGNYSLGGVVNV